MPNRHPRDPQLLAALFWGMTLRRRTTLLLAGLCGLVARDTLAQATHLQRGSENIDAVGHLPMGARLTVTDMEIEQELDRPYAYVSRANVVGGGERGYYVYDVTDVAAPALDEETEVIRRKPVTVGYYDTYLGPLNEDFNPVFNGTFGVDVRNEDGLIVVSDSSTGLWVFRMEGFSGWNGEQWGYPNISSVQHWDRGPVQRRLIGGQP